MFFSDGTKREKNEDNAWIFTINKTIRSKPQTNATTPEVNDMVNPPSPNVTGQPVVIPQSKSLQRILMPILKEVLHSILSIHSQLFPSSEAY